MNNPPSRELRLTKVGGAVRQIEAAIAAFEIGHFDIAVTLASAAEGMLPGTGKSIFDRLKTAPAALERMSKKNWINEINGAVYWLKHHNEKDPPAIVLTAAEAAFALARAASNVPAASWSPRMDAFRVWLLGNLASL